MALYFPKINQLRFHQADGIEWYLPSYDELYAMYTVLHLNGVGSFTADAAKGYWSSTEASANNADSLEFALGHHDVLAKGTSLRIRACRTFTSDQVYALRDIGPSGGYIFSKVGNTYIEAAPVDLSSSQSWSSVTATAVTGTSTAIGAGLANTLLIIAQAGQVATSAAELCHAMYVPLLNSQKNNDNRDTRENFWIGVYQHTFYQPILKSWSGLVGDGNELDFCIHSSSATWAAAAYNMNVYKLTDADDTKPVFVETLTPSDFFTYSSGIHVYRFTKSLGAYADGFYFVRVIYKGTTAQGVKYQSNIFEVADSFDDCFTFSATNFENGFGQCWINTTPTTWYLKLLMPFRMYKAMPKVEKDVYDNDSGGQTTLRATIQRVHEFESLPVPIWYAELFQMATALSTTYLNRIAINFNEIPGSEIISESDLCVVKGQATDVNFNDKYLLNI